MRVTKITYRRGITLNVGDFESVRVDIEATADADKGESFEECYSSLKELVDDAVREEARAVRNKTRRSGS
jgi:hypothetical protein